MVRTRSGRRPRCGRAAAPKRSQTPTTSTSAVSVALSVTWRLSLFSPNISTRQIPITQCWWLHICFVPVPLDMDPKVKAIIFATAVLVVSKLRYRYRHCLDRPYAPLQPTVEGFWCVHAQHPHTPSPRPTVRVCVCLSVCVSVCVCVCLALSQQPI